MTINDKCFFLGGQPRSGTTLLTSLLNSSIDLFQAYELHIRKPSFILGNNKNYTKNIFKYLGLSETKYLEIIDNHKKNFENMNLGNWSGPKEYSSAELLTGKETVNFSSELLFRGQLVSELMNELKYIHKKKYWGFKILNDMIHIDEYFKIWLVYEENYYSFGKLGEKSIITCSKRGRSYTQAFVAITVSVVLVVLSVLFLIKKVKLVVDTKN